MVTPHLERLLENEQEPMVGNNLELVQVKETYDWCQGSGTYINIVSNKGFKIDYATYDPHFGISVIDPVTLGQHFYTYEIFGDLEYLHEPVENRFSEGEEKDFLKIRDGTKLVMESGVLSLDKYYMAHSARIRSFGVVYEPDTIKTSTHVQLVSSENKEPIALLYIEHEYPGKKADGSLYLSYNHSMFPLDMEKNAELTLMMQIVGALHANKLRKSTIQVVDYTEPTPIKRPF